jgi:hypothetical protein
MRPHPTPLTLLDDVQRILAAARWLARGTRYKGRPLRAAAAGVTYLFDGAVIDGITVGSRPPGFSLASDVLPRHSEPNPRNRKGPGKPGLFVVAGAGFEPATFGL